MARSKAQQDCISAKIPILRKEGMEEDQAVAVAIKKCAPETSKQLACCPACDVGDPCEKKSPGYAFQQLPSGMFRVFNVPIMAEVPPG